MNKAVALINAWGNFDDNHPESSLEDFCRHYLAHQQRKPDVTPPTPTPPFLPVSTDGKLMRLIGRIFKVHTIYTTAALEGTGISNIDEYALLNTITQLQDPRKTEVIYTALQELSTGTDKLNRLKKLGYLTEHEDKEDKRSKRLKITAKGEKVLELCRKRISRLAVMMLHEVPEEDKLLCLQLLGGVETRFTDIWQSHKGKSFDEIFKEVVGK